MPVPSPRTPICIARGNKSDLAANISALQDGEICYALDEDTLYVKEGGLLVKASGSTYTLPPATAAVLGGIKVGANLTIQGDGTLSATPPSTSIPDGVQNLDLLQWNGATRAWEANRITDGGNF